MRVSNSRIRKFWSSSPRGKPLISAFTVTFRGCASVFSRQWRNTPAESPWTSRRWKEFAKDLDPSALTDPSKLEALMQQGTFEPQNTPEQKAALERLETLLALVEGWVETVVTAALGERLPGVAAMSETLRRRRATGGPAEQTFATLVGLELRPRKVR